MVFYLFILKLKNNSFLKNVYPTSVLFENIAKKEVGLLK